MGIVGGLTYLERAEALRIVPNFWLTQEYLSIQDTTIKSNGKVIWIQEDDWAIFPPLPISSDVIHPGDCPPLRIWSDFENFTLGEKTEFLDWEYTYDSNNFFDMEGGKWKTFRKNVRKWPQRNKEWKYVRTPPPLPEIEGLLIKWLECRGGEIHDDESLLWFVCSGGNRSFIFKKDKLVGINVWDANGDYLMYRYCIVDPEEPFLDEFCRWLFYQTMPNRLVIDGGCLGNPGLERFKDRLNPVKKRAIYSRVIGKEVI